MTTDFQPSPPGNPPPPEKKNVFARVAGVLFALRGFAFHPSQPWV